ncbi:MAG: 2-C-methyl-D-erythritol 2,4-cyclodiphosphate synthase [Phycisphaerales bacterium]|nr:2-C-methyl-D-erythritol 2,4-cyclodiphosphate synthase [Phycisphaerales bacterium]
MRVGHGYDLHRLEALPPDGRGKPLILGGIHIPHHTGPVAHSDGDVLLHAMTDAILGALGLPDIGRLFPDTDAANKDANSVLFLCEALRLMRASAFEIGNVDCTVICETPKIGPLRDALVAQLAQLLECPIERINVKGKTHEKVDAVGEGRAIEVHVVALLRSKAASHD